MSAPHEAADSIMPRMTGNSAYFAPSSAMTSGSPRRAAASSSGNIRAGTLRKMHDDIPGIHPETEPGIEVECPIVGRHDAGGKSLARLGREAVHFAHQEPAAPPPGVLRAHGDQKHVEWGRRLQAGHKPGKGAAPVKCAQCPIGEFAAVALDHPVPE